MYASPCVIFETGIRKRSAKLLIHPAKKNRNRFLLHHLICDFIFKSKSDMKCSASTFFFCSLRKADFAAIANVISAISEEFLTFFMSFAKL
jgi:hypothetical protein